jgi:hypothetical protein
MHFYSAVKDPSQAQPVLGQAVEGRDDGVGGGGGGVGDVVDLCMAMETEREGESTGRVRKARGDRAGNDGWAK